VSKGVFGQHADDPQWVFIAWEPLPGPRWRAVLAVLFWLGAAGLVAANTTGSTRVILSLATLVFVTLPLWPRGSSPDAPTLEQFDAMRRAGTLALATFRASHPEVIRASWYVRESRPDGSFVIVVSGQTVTTPPHRVGLCESTIVTRDGDVIAAEQPPSTATVHIAGCQRDTLVQRENERS